MPEKKVANTFEAQKSVDSASPSLFISTRAKARMDASKLGFDVDSHYDKLSFSSVFSTF